MRARVSSAAGGRALVAAETPGRRWAGLTSHPCTSSFGTQQMSGCPTAQLSPAEVTPKAAPEGEGGKDGEQGCSARPQLTQQHTVGLQTPPQRLFSLLSRSRRGSRVPGNRLEVKTVEGGHSPGASRTSVLPDPGHLQSSWVSQLVHSNPPPPRNHVLSL